MRYYNRAGELRWLADKYQYKLPSDLTIRFFVTMPLSWSRKRRLSMDGQPHQQTPDCDNMVKFFLDSLTYQPKDMARLKQPKESDAHIWHIDATKYWTSKDGYMEVEV